MCRLKADRLSTIFGNPMSTHSFNNTNSRETNWSNFIALQSTCLGSYLGRRGLMYRVGIDQTGNWVNNLSWSSVCGVGENALSVC